MRLLLWVSLTLSVASFGACITEGETGTSPDPSTGDPNQPESPAVACTPDNIATTLFARKCAGCHSGSNAPKGLDLVAAGVADRIAQKTSSCLNKKIVVPGNPATSFLLEKVSDNPSCGVRMPKEKPELTADEKNCIADWIQSLPPDTGEGNGGLPPGGGGGDGGGGGGGW